MAIFDCNAEVSGYHADEVTLGKDDQDEMRDRRDNGRTRLTKGLERDGHPRPYEQASQGSYAMRTMHQDEQCDYDIDDAIYFDQADLKDAFGFDSAPKAARERVCKALQQDDRLKYPAENKANCVRQRYPEGYHIDIPVYRIIRGTDANGNETITYEHASGDAWTKSDARAVTRWYNNQVGELNTGQSDGSQMRRITRLTKKQGRSRIEWKPKTTSGITMTKLVVDHFVASAGRDDESLYLTLKAIRATLNVSTRVQHPVLQGKDLANEGDAEVAYFRDRLAEALTALAVVEKSDCTRTQARRAWDDVFGTTYFSDQPNDDDKESTKRGPFITTSTDVARRDDGERRFG
ncbi:MAG: hypothetical protein JWN43_4581 [Gammaproteobacteria bacterium]|nr:hypothetical protein [Gammaproteobacteria bacterium]